MTLTRELRTSIAFMLAIVLALTAFVWGNQRLVHATLATEILCLVDQVGDDGDGNTGIFPMFEEDCEDDGGQVIDWCPDLPGNQSQSDLPCTVPPQCNDGIDNDHDGKVDWGVPGDADADPGCSTPTDDNEGDDPTPPAAQCADGLDNDNDGKVDMADPGCSSSSDNDETDQGGGGNNNPACSDGQDNDQDGKVDFPADPGCSDANDTDETDGQGGGGGSPQCSDGVDNDADGAIDLNDSGCTDAQDNDEADESNGGGSSGGSSHRHSGGSRSNNSNQGEVLGAETECPMYLTGYIKYGGNNDAGEVAKLQVFLNTYEGNTLPVTGTYGPATLAAVNAFQNKYASDILTPWGAKGATGYVYYTTQKQINTIYCKFQKDFPLSASQIEEIAYVRQVQPTLRAQGVTSMSTTQAKPAMVVKTTSVGSVVSPTIKVDENKSIIDPKVQTATTANATSTGSGKGWFTNFINWLFGR